MGLREDIDNYNEQMLRLQFQASDNIQHKLTQGELREKFLKQFFRMELDRINIKNGILISGDWQSSQGDFLVLNKNARLGSMSIYDIDDCLLFMEIKSKVTKVEFEELQKHAYELKSKNKKIMVGMFSYSSRAKRQTIVPKFGFDYDKSMDMFDTYNKKSDIYPDIDFYYNLNIYQNNNEELPYYIVKDISGERVLFLQPPVIGYLINLFRSVME